MRGFTYKEKKYINKLLTLTENLTDTEFFLMLNKEGENTESSRKTKEVYRKVLESPAYLKNYDYIESSIAENIISLTSN